MHRYIYLFITLVIYSCEKEVDLTPANSNDKIVVEGVIQAGYPAYVMLTKSTPYFSTVNAESFENIFVTDAIVSVKKFGGENSSRFVNGVLGAVYKEIGEPGKEEQGKKRKKDIPFDQMPIQRLAGAVVYAEHEGQLYLALVHDIFGHWTLSKGKIEDEETVEEGAIREIKEEMGLDISIESELGNNEYVASHPELGKVRKQVHYFLAAASYSDIKLEQKGGLDDAKWFKVADILELNFYEDILPIVTKAITMLVGRGAK